jgi:hypothetical protein
VRRVEVDGTTVTATVDGTSVYRVHLEVAGGGLRGRCTCPYGLEGVFCKHRVAVALVWLADGAEVGEPRPAPVSDQRLRAFLLGQDPAWLVDQLLSAARTDPLLRARLDVAAGADVTAAYDAGDLRDRLARAIEIGDYVDYGGAYSYFDLIEGALDAVAELVDGGFPDTAITLAEYALDLLEGAAGRVDDSDGGLGGPSPGSRRSTWRPARQARPTRSRWPSGWSGVRWPATTRCSSTCCRTTSRCWGRRGWPATASWSSRHGTRWRRGSRTITAAAGSR